MKRSPRAPVLLWFFLLATLHSPGAKATTVLQVSLEQLTRTADVIVEGTVRRTSCGRVGGRLFTYALIRVKTWHKDTGGVGGHGSATKEILVRVPGGRMGDEWWRVEGMPLYQKGEDVLLFLKRQQGFYWTLGLQQGKFRLTRDRRGARHAERRFQGLGFLRSGPSRQPRISLTYPELISRVRRALRGSPG